MTTSTPLYNSHADAGAKFVDFFGWNMPIHYGSQVQEHRAVRNQCGIFDVSHMTIVDLKGKQVTSFLRYLLANDVAKLKHSGRALYTCMLNFEGGIIDDLLIYKLEDEFYRLVVNCVTREKDLNWIKTQAQDYEVNIEEQPKLIMIAIQGPEAREHACKMLPAALEVNVNLLKRFQCLLQNNWFFARTGYTGEDGFEVITPQEDAIILWQQLIDEGIQPCGLGARDTLRLEAGLNLYGQDMDESVTPYESNLSWTVSLDDEARNFIGKEALQKQKHEGIKQKLVGIVIKDRAVIRHGCKVLVESAGEGIVTSGTYSPSLSLSIGLARVPTAAEAYCQVEIRNKMFTADIVKPPFIHNGIRTFD